MKRKIEQILRKSHRNLCQEDKSFCVKKLKMGVFVPNSSNYGDYSTNIALVIAEKTRKNPKSVADSLIKHILTTKSSLKTFEKVEEANGFINFFLSKDILLGKLAEIIKLGKDFGKPRLAKSRKVQVEFISANPTGPLTVGNARGGPFGDCLANVLSWAGYKTKKAYYVNDCGEQIVELGKSVLGVGGKYKGPYIDDLKGKIKTKTPYLAGKKAARFIIQNVIKPTVRKLGIKYDEWFFESKLHSSKSVDKVITSLKNKKLTYKKDGAIWFRSKRFGDTRDRVLVKKNGTKTYLAGDIAYHQYKFKKKKFDKVINIWGADHYGDVAGLQAGVSALGYKGKLDIILLQFVTIVKNGKHLKMSKRRGTYITMDKLLSLVGKDAVRFFFLEKSSDTHLNFDLDLAREQSEKNPVYYVQYAYARICSILRKRGKSRVPSNKLQTNSKLKLLNHPSELNLIKQLIRFPEVVREVSETYQVQRLPKYAIELASSFHYFYQQCKVLSEEEDLKEARLSLVLATKIILESLFALIGISAPKKM